MSLQDTTITDLQEGVTDVKLLTTEKDKLTALIRTTKDPAEKQALILRCKALGTRIKDLQPKKEPTEKEIQKVQNLVTKVCANCNGNYETSGKTRIPIVYCRECRVIRGKDILEWVTADSFECYQQHQQAEAETKMSQNPAQFRLDLHKTLDTCAPETVLPDHTCCISYVGSLTQTRINARTDIQDRVRSGQLKYGVLVFKRGSDSDPVAANRYQEVGSKAWFNKHTPGIEGKSSVFVDDSMDHILSVRSVGIQSVHKIDRKGLIGLITPFI